MPNEHNGFQINALALFAKQREERSLRMRWKGKARIVHEKKKKKKIPKPRRISEMTFALPQQRQRQTVNTGSGNAVFREQHNRDSRERGKMKKGRERNEGVPGRGSGQLPKKRTSVQNRAFTWRERKQPKASGPASVAPSVLNSRVRGKVAFIPPCIGNQCPRCCRPAKQ